MSLLLKDVLSMAEARFKREGILTPKLDAEMLFSFVSNKDKTWQFINYGRMIDEDLCAQYFDLVDERGGGRPLQYITGSQEFMGLPFVVNENVLIPRQDTELLVEKTLEIIENTKSKKNLHILDLCCGSGAIGISMAHKLKSLGRKAKIYCSDISEKALAIAKQNAGLNNVEKMIEFSQGDLFKPFPKNRKGKGKRAFDFILTNPPYIPSKDISGLMREVRDHEPLIALDGGESGLDYYEKILKEASAHLAKEGLLILEIGYNQGEALLKMAESLGKYDKGDVIKDYASKDRLVVLSLKAGS